MNKFFKIIALVIFGVAFAFPAVSQEAEDLEAKERFEFEERVKEYILANPEIIAQAIQMR